MSTTLPTAATNRAIAWSTRVRTWDEIGSVLACPLELPRPVRLHLIRHGETTTNAAGLVTGARDVPLTPRGEEQAIAVGRELDGFYALAFHSPLQRSAHTLRLALAAGRVEVGAVFADPRLAERSLGELEMQPSRPVAEFARGDFLYAPPGGDSYAEVARRVMSFLLDLRDLVVTLPVEAVLICSHMGAMRLLVGTIQEDFDPNCVLALAFPNSELLRLDWRRLVFPPFLASVALGIFSHE